MAVIDSPAGRRVAMAVAVIVAVGLAVVAPSLLNPFGVYLMNVYARDAVPDELLDAARVDGAGEFRTFFTIALPLLTSYALATRKKRPLRRLYDRRAQMMKLLREEFERSTGEPIDAAATDSFLPQHR